MAGGSTRGDCRRNPRTRAWPVRRRVVRARGALVGRVLAGDAATGLRPLYCARYVDWAFTTPALLFTPAATALGSAARRGARRPALVAGLLLSDLFMTLAGVFASLSADAASKWTWYAVSCAFFLAATLFSAPWLAYPVVWVLGRAGLRAVGGATEAGLYTALDLAAEVGHGLSARGRLPRLEPPARHYRPPEETLAPVAPRASPTSA